MIKIIADNKIPFLKRLFDGIAEIEFLPAKEITNSTVKNADALIIRTRTKCDDELLKNSKVRFIASATIGFDHIDTLFCKKNNIKWTNAPGCNAESVEQYMYSALLNLAQKRNFTLAGKTLGIIGVGNVGKRVKAVAEKLGMKVLLNDPPRERNKESTTHAKLNNTDTQQNDPQPPERGLLAPFQGVGGRVIDLEQSNFKRVAEESNKFVNLKEIQQKADIITIHTPLNKTGIDKTFHLINENFFKEIKKTSIIINTARGEIIDNLALKKALKNKQIAGAILDVWENEPNIDTELLKLVDFGTPHIAGYSADGKANCTWNSFKSVCQFFNLEYNSAKAIEIPIPKKINFAINCENKTPEQIRTEIINISYNIYTDDKLLRKQTKKFENLRNNYPSRRKLSIFGYKLLNLNNSGNLSIEL